MRRALGLILLSVLVVLAGCSGVFGGGGGEPTETVTPAAVPTDEPTPTPAPRLAPGITEQGIVSPRALVAAHQTFLQNRSFTRRSDSTALTANGSILVQTTSTLRAGPPGEGLYSVIERNGSYPQEPAAPSTRSEAWRSGEQDIIKRTFRNGTTTYSRQSTSTTRTAVTSGTLPYLLEPFNTNNSAVTERFARNGTTLYRVRGVTRADVAGNMTLRLLVDSRGVVHEYTTIRWLPSSMNISKSITKTRFIAINETDAPERPSWVDDALNRTTSTASSGTELAG
jgi:hypothetical protein